MDFNQSLLIAAAQNLRLTDSKDDPSQGSEPIECLEYVVVHELAHFIEPTHNSSFIGLLNNLMPNWKSYREQLYLCD